jgi:hypothetical protein
MLLRNQLYAGVVDVPEYGVRGKRGGFEPLVSENDAAQTRSPIRISNISQIESRVVRQRIESPDRAAMGDHRPSVRLPSIVPGQPRIHV